MLENLFILFQAFEHLLFIFLAFSHGGIGIIGNRQAVLLGDWKISPGHGENERGNLAVVSSPMYLSFWPAVSRAKFRRVAPPGHRTNRLGSRRESVESALVDESNCVRSVEIIFALSVPGLHRALRRESSG